MSHSPKPPPKPSGCWLQAQCWTDVSTWKSYQSYKWAEKRFKGQRTTDNLTAERTWWWWLFGYLKYEHPGISFAYWSLDGTQSSGRTRSRGTEETFGILNMNWDGPYSEEHLGRIAALIGLPEPSDDQGHAKKQAGPGEKKSKKKEVLLVDDAVDDYIWNDGDIASSGKEGSKDGGISERQSRRTSAEYVAACSAALILIAALLWALYREYDSGIERGIATPDEVGFHAKSQC